ncbi:hypothetical protein IWZ00DRAFT_559878 [Phyllosticta capitalensis]|uniref:Uncharacterized protein n=1 Tax=Phyllosticta capitalensis TaxID=121624 RepID=A0ABR1Z4K1_9PEZI
MPRRVTYVNMEDSGTGGWRLCHQVDISEDVDMWAADAEENGPLASQNPCYLALIIHPDDTQEYKDIDLSDVNTISIRSPQLPSKLRIIRPLDENDNLPQSMMFLGSLIPREVNRIIDRCEVIDVGVGFWQNGAPTCLNVQYPFLHNYWLPYENFVVEDPEYDNTFVDQPVALYFYHDSTITRTMIRACNRNGVVVEYVG